MAGVYHPSRLKIISNCKTVSGTVVGIKSEADDDYHINLKVDSKYGNLINTNNVKYEHGALVVEVIPMDRPNIPKPYVGEHLTVTGSYVDDSAHGWMEIHPAWIVNGKGTTSYTSVAAQKSMTEGVCGNGDSDCPTKSSTSKSSASNGSTSVSKPTSSTSSSTVTIVSVTSTATRGSYATLNAKVKPGANASIVVYYNSGPSKSESLYPKNADGNGNVSWTWKVGTRTASGTYEIDVSSDGKTTTTHFTVE